MKTPPLYLICSADPGVTALLGTDPVRMFMFGMAPQDVRRPYATWQIISGSPGGYLTGRPDAEHYTVQVDVWADDPDEAQQALAAIEYAVELHCSVTRYGNQMQDPETKSYRAGMDLSWITNRSMGAAGQH